MRGAASSTFSPPTAPTLPLRVRGRTGNLTVFFKPPTCKPIARPPPRKRARPPLQEVPLFTTTKSTWPQRRARGARRARAGRGGWRGRAPGRPDPRRWSLRAPSLRHLPACSEQSLADHGSHFLLTSPVSVDCDVEMLIDTYGSNDALFCACLNAYGSNDALFFEGPAPPLPSACADAAGCSDDDDGRPSFSGTPDAAPSLCRLGGGALPPASAAASAPPPTSA